VNLKSTSSSNPNEDLKCPICSVLLSSSLPNYEINDHIDSCLNLSSGSTKSPTLTYHSKKKRMLGNTTDQRTIQNNNGNSILKYVKR
jgi:hypothetical protein